MLSNKGICEGEMNEMIYFKHARFPVITKDIAYPAVMAY